MDLLTKLEEARTSNTVVYTRFLQQYSHRNMAIHIFHEGKDDPSFYGNFLERKLKKGQEIYYYNCQNKSNVYENYGLLNWTTHKKNRILFFVDKDFSDILKIAYPSDTNIFVTKYYSIENYLVTLAIYKRCLRDLAGFEDPDIAAFEKIFVQGLKRFYKAATVFSAYLIFHRKLGSTLNLRNLKLRTVLNFPDPERPFEVARVSKVREKVDNQCSVKDRPTCYADLRAIVKKLDGLSDPKEFVRGKFEIAFLVHSINTAIDIANKRPGRKKKRMPITLSTSNAVQVIAPRLRQPSDIAKFIRVNLG